MSNNQKFVRAGLAVETIGHITQAAEDAIAALKEHAGHDAFAYLVFNDIPIRVDAASTVESICADYDQKRKDHHYGEHCPARLRCTGTF